MIQGECLCKSVKFQADELPGLVFNCHCLKCKRSHGAAFATQVMAQKDSLQYLSGKELVQEYNSCLLYTSPSPRDRG